MAGAVARETGYKTAFWLDIPGKSENRPGDDPYSLCGLKHDWIFRLPGRVRRSLLSVLGGKLNRRLSGAPHV